MELIYLMQPEALLIIENDTGEEANGDRTHSRSKRLSD